ncbi:12795_t:CDS:2, partial [Funneliformis caledonium]
FLEEIVQMGHQVEVGKITSDAIYCLLENDIAHKDLCMRGHLYEHDIGKYKSEKHACEWYMKSAEGGDAYGHIM